MSDETFRIDEPLQVGLDPVEQWLHWEERANLPGFRAPAEVVEIDVVSVPRDAVHVETSLGPDHPVLRRFLRGERVMLPRHPLNRDASVAYFDAPVAERWGARYTSSRTLAFSSRSGEPLFSVKLPTDHPHRDFHQPEKARMREETRDALRALERLDRAGRILGAELSLRVLREVLAVWVPDTESAFLVRDLSPFQRGSYYLPGLSIPWVGRQLARRHGVAFESFWEEHYAAASGRAKAVLFARGGLQQKTPNPQNLLVELDTRLLPTGTIVLRDIGDADCVTDSIPCTEGIWSRLTGELKPETKNTFWAFDEAFDHSVETSTLERWHRAHDHAYFGTLARYFPSRAPERVVDAAASLQHWSDALR